MRWTTILAVLAIAGGSASSQAAERAPSAKAAKAKPHRAAPADRVYDDRDATRWYPRDVDRLKFGSRIWWDQMEAEGRLSRPENN